MKERLRPLFIDTALFTTLAIGWLMETTGFTVSHDKLDSSERKLRLTTTGLTVGLLVALLTYRAYHR